MRRYIFLLGALILPFSIRAASSLFTYDHQRVDRIFAGLTSMDRYAEFQYARSLSHMNLSSLFCFTPEDEASKDKKDKKLGIPGFLWGLIASLPGVIYVYVSTTDKNERQQALYGCMTSGYVIGCCLLFTGPPIY